MNSLPSTPSVHDLSRLSNSCVMSQSQIPSDDKDKSFDTVHLASKDPTTGQLKANMLSLNPLAQAYIDDGLCRMVVFLSLVVLHSDQRFFYYIDRIVQLSSTDTKILISHMKATRDLVKQFSGPDHVRAWHMLCDLITKNALDKECLSSFPNSNQWALIHLCETLRQYHDSDIAIHNRCISDCLHQSQQALLDILGVIDATIAYQSPEMAHWPVTLLNQERVYDIADIFHHDIVLSNEKGLSNDHWFPFLLKPDENNLKTLQDMVLDIVGDDHAFSVIIVANEHTISLNHITSGDWYWCDINHLNTKQTIAVHLTQKPSTKNDPLWYSLVQRFSLNEHDEPVSLLGSCLILAKNTDQRHSSLSERIQQKRSTIINHAAQWPLFIQKQLMDLCINNNSDDGFQKLINHSQTYIGKNLHLLTKPCEQEYNLLAQAISVGSDKIVTIILGIKSLGVPFELLSQVLVLKYRMTALHLASAYGSTSIVSTIYALINPVNTQSKQHWLTLISQKTQSGSSSIWLAANRNHSETLKVLINTIKHQPKVLRTLLTACNKQGKPLISVIISLGYNDVFLVLMNALKNDKDALTQRDKNDLSPLDWAEKERQIHMADRLRQAVQKTSNSDCIIL